MTSSRLWATCTLILAVLAVAAAVAVHERDRALAFSPPGSGFYAAIDCDLSQAGVQDVCTLPPSTTSLTVAVVAGNVDVANADISAIQFDVIANQASFDPTTGADADKNSNPDFNDAAFTAGTWACTPPSPSRDVNSDPAVADSFLSCFNSNYQGGEPFGPGSLTRLATVKYNVVSPNGGVFSLYKFSVGDTVGVELMSCNPGLESPAPCSPATVSIGAPPPTNTPTPTNTAPAGSTVTPTSTFTPVATFTPTATSTPAWEPTVTPIPTATSTPIPPPPLDTDADGMSDVYELAHSCLNVMTPDGDGDPDSDGLTSRVEAAILTDACAADSDTDGMSDGYEDANACLDPLVPASTGSDSDSDGLPDQQEANLRTLACVPDTDADGYNDGLEVSLGESPLRYCSIMRADTNGDRKANSIDLMLVAREYGLTPPGNPRMDQGNDGRVNSLDLLRVALVFSKTVSQCD